MAAYRRVYDSRHLQADCQEPGSAPEPYDRYSRMGYLSLYAPSAIVLEISLVKAGRLKRSRLHYTQGDGGAILCHISLGH